MYRTTVVYKTFAETASGMIMDMIVNKQFQIITIDKPSKYFAANIFEMYIENELDSLYSKHRKSKSKK